MNATLRYALPVTFAALLGSTGAHAQGRLQERFNAAVKVGMDAPAIKLSDTEGKAWDVTAFRGKSWVVVHFGACT